MAETSAQESLFTDAPNPDMWEDPDAEPVKKEANEDKGITIPDDQKSHDEWEPNEAEEQALKGGWKPNADDMDNPDEWVSAKEFNFRGELMQRIRDLGRELGTLKGENAKLGKMVAKSDQITQQMVEDAYNRAMNNLKAQRREATREGDYDVVDDIEEAMEELKDTHSKMEANESGKDLKAAEEVSATPVQQAWYHFATTTKWAQNPEIFRPLIQYAEGVVADEPTIDVGDFMEKVLEKGKELRGVGRKGPAGPDDSKGSSHGRSGGMRGSRGKFSAKDLNEQQRHIAKQFEEDGISADEYATMLGKEGALDKQRGR